MDSELMFGSLLLTIMLAQVGIEVIKSLFISKLFPVDTLREDERKWLGEIHKTLSKTDVEGVPLTYSPRAWNETQKEMLECIREISLTQKQTTYAMEGLVKAIEKLTDKLEKEG